MQDHEEGYPSLDAELFGRKLRKACERRHVTAGELQRFLHLGSVQAVYMWFEGKRLPNLDNLYAISKYLHLSMEELLEERGKEEERLMEKDPVQGIRKRLLFYWMHL